MSELLHSIMVFLSQPSESLPSVFIVSFLSATLLPLGSEPLVFAVIKSNPGLFWPTILIATIGNTLGGVVTYFMGYGAKQMFSHNKPPRYLIWLQRFGPKTMFLSFLPIIGDPLCGLAGWLKMPFGPCLFYMCSGKFLRYLIMTYLLLKIPNGFWNNGLRLLGG